MTVFKRFVKNYSYFEDKGNSFQNLTTDERLTFLIQLRSSFSLLSFTWIGFTEPVKLQELTSIWLML